MGPAGGSNLGLDENGVSAAAPAANGDRNADGIVDAEGTTEGVCPNTLANDTQDDDNDGEVVNDGCPALGAPEVVCSGSVDDDADGWTNDGCPAVGTPETGLCGNSIDDDPWRSVTLPTFRFDSVGDDGCVVRLSRQETCVEIIADGQFNADEDLDADLALFDITVGAQPGPGGGIPASRPIKAWQFDLNWSVDVLDVLVADQAFLIHSAGARAPFGNIQDLTPNDSPFTHAVSDGGPPESGPGVLDRFLIIGNAAGLADFTVTNIELVDAVSLRIPIEVVRTAKLAVSKDGPDDGTVIGDSLGELFGCGPDHDHDGVYNVDETPCGGDAFDPFIRPERTDTPGDDDGDGLVNEPLPGGSAGFDCDGDGWTGGQEISIFSATGTANDQDPCGGDGWPADGSPDNKIDIGDLNRFIFPLRTDGSFNKFGHSVPDSDDPNLVRWDLAPNGIISIGDLNALNPAVLASTARPPMFAGLPAFFTDLDGPGPLQMGECPYPP